MDLDAIADELYAAAPEEFVALRKQRAADARSAGDRTLSKQVAALRRPTRSAWIVNLIADRASGDLAALLDLGTALADAQQRLSGDDLRRLSGQRHAAIAALTRRGGQLAEVRGHRPAEATMREVSETLQAALSDPEIAAVVRAGHLTQARTYSGFGPEPIITPASALAAEPDSEPSDGPVDSSVDHEAQAEAAHNRLVERLSDAQATYDRIAVQTERAAQQLARLTEKADHQAALVDDLRGQLDRARSALDSVTADVERQRSRLTELQRSEQRAQEDVSDALTALTTE